LAFINHSWFIKDKCTIFEETRLTHVCIFIIKKRSWKFRFCEWWIYVLAVNDLWFLWLN
jgi:hypothetical protein